MLLAEQVSFEAYVNNVGDDQQPRPHLSMLGAPIEQMVNLLREYPGLRHKRVDILIDEYENFSDYQQQVVNTLIKHSTDALTYKVGVKELGWRVRTTLNENEQLISPSDYDLIDVAEALTGEAFRQFASDVCLSRLSRLTAIDTTQSLVDLFPGLSEDDEALRLGSESITAPFQYKLEGPELEAFRGLGASSQVVVVRWAEQQSRSPSEAVQDLLLHPAQWRARFNNYKHSYLYSLRRRRSGIRKYYCGWDVLIQLAGGNIRYLLEVVEESLVSHIRAGGDIASPVPVDLQTKCAAKIAAKNLAELEGLAISGTKITKLVLSLGRVFQLMAQDPSSHTPEVNEFRVRDSAGLADVESDADKLLDSAVMHLALVRSPGNKLASAQTREYDYALHPLYCALFTFSYRRKRKMVVTADDLVGLVNDPPTHIREVLKASNRETDDDLPEQLALFRDYYA